MNLFKNSNGNFNNNDVFDRVYIKDVLDSLDDITDVNTTSRITATVTQIMHNEKNFYQGCSDRNCKRKLQYDSENKIAEKNFLVDSSLQTVCL